MEEYVPAAGAGDGILLTDLPDHADALAEEPTTLLLLGRAVPMAHRLPPADPDFP